MHARFASVLALAAISLAGCAPATTPVTIASASGGTTTLLTRLGVDTLALEQYTRTATRMDGTIISRTPSSSIARYTVTLGASGEPQTAEMTVRRGDGSIPQNGMQSVAVQWTADSMRFTGRRPAGDTVRAIAASGMRIPYVGNSYGLFELAMARLVSSGRDSIDFALAPLGFGTRATIALPMRRLGGDSIRYGWFGNPFYARHDGRGGVLWLDGRQTAIKVRVDRVATVDLDAIVKGWSAREASGMVAGAPSTRDTTRATIGAAQLWVDYGRPLLRGRDVWVNGVLGDTLWRTGANAATQLRTNVDLLIGGQSVPAGTYSLWTWAGRNGYHLVVNRQAGQWGTEYHPDRDLVRVPLQETNVSGSVERFTITVEPQGASTGQLVMAWGGKRLSVPITTR